MDDSSKKKDRFFMGPSVSENTRMFLKESKDGVVAGLVSTDREALPKCDSALSLDHVGGDVYEVAEEISMTTQGDSDNVRTGPSKVNTPQFQAGWDAIFGNKTTVGQA